MTETETEQPEQQDADHGHPNDCDGPLVDVPVDFSTPLS